MRVGRGALLICMLAVGAIGLAACGSDVCESASVIIAECTGTALEDPAPSEGEDVDSCVDNQKTSSQCIVDNEKAYCDYLKDPVNAENPCG